MLEGGRCRDAQALPLPSGESLARCSAHFTCTRSIQYLRTILDTHTPFLDAMLEQLPRHAALDVSTVLPGAVLRPGPRYRSAYEIFLSVASTSLEVQQIYTSMRKPSVRVRKASCWVVALPLL